MRTNTRSLAALLLIVLPFIPVRGLAVSSAVKSQVDYTYTLEVMRNLRVIVDNFGDAEQAKQYDEIKALFRSAAEEFYAQNFVSSYQKFFILKERLASFSSAVSDIYIKRTKDILDSTSKSSFDILLKYSREGGLIKYVRKPFDPVYGMKQYKEEEYHFFHSKEVIERYLRNGYKRLQDAKNILNDQDLQYIKNKKTRTSSNLDMIIYKNMRAIDECRQGKQYGIEIHKLLKVHQIGDIQKKYNLPNMPLEPIFDDRIPEEYKVDANDNLRLIHSLEKERMEKVAKKP
ncbi:MAG TPA: hypothetical protein ENN21_03140 [Spirochaetes bacterium]|nr:hypothetical protein [Spirochaetota bacterium]